MQNLAQAPETDEATIVARYDPLSYREYIDLLFGIFKHLRSYYRSGADGLPTQEEESMALYVQKLLDTMRALRLKFRWGSFSAPGIDLKESGFPNFIDIMRLETDLCARVERLP